MIPRRLLHITKSDLALYPAVAILGPRQMGKTTLAMECSKDLEAGYVDFASFDTLTKVRRDPEAFVKTYSHKLLILDEVQRFPDMFVWLRGVIDAYIRDGRKSGHFLILGSASRDLLKQSSESLAGRIKYLELTGIMPTEIESSENTSQFLDRLWLRGGFPLSYLSSTEVLSLQWRKGLVLTYIEKDIPELAAPVPSEVLQRLLTMLAHQQGEVFCRLL